MKKPMVLVVDLDTENLEWERTFLEEALEDGALICRGPTGHKTCPLLTGADCALIHDADGILFELDLDKSQSRRILQRYKDDLDIPIRVVATPEDMLRYSSLLEGLEVVTPPIGPAKLDAFAAEVESEVE